MVKRNRPASGQKAAKLDADCREHYNGDMDRGEFDAHVRDALAHLYDVSYLNRHKLAGLVAAMPNEPAGQALHRALLEAIEQLHPPDRVPPTASAWRPYMALSLRYAAEQATQQTAQEIGISLRQLRREHARGMQMLLDSLWERHGQAAGASGNETSGLSDVNSEVARLSGVRSDSLTDLPTVVASVIETLAKLADAREASFAVRLPARLPHLRIERSTLRQILLNVLAHVLERENAGRITVTALIKSGRIDVEIGRRGIAGASSSAESRDERLVVAEELLAGQGGRLVATDGEHEAYVLELPVQPSSLILVVDDNQEMIQLFRRFLAASSYDVAGATTGQEGVHLAEELHPSLIILDVMIPGQDGWEVLQHLRNDPATQDIPVIVCSVLKEQDLAFSLGATQFLSKPVTQLRLLDAIAAILTPSP